MASSPPSAKDVVEYTTVLENQYAPFQKQSQLNADVYTRRRLPKLPKDLARSEAVYILSDDVKKEAKTLSAYMLAMQTTLEVLAQARDPDGGMIKQADKDLADQLEQAFALIWHRLNPNRMLEAATIWRQMVQPVGVIILEMAGIDTLKPASRFPWTAYNIETDGTGWHERDGVPTIFGRHFKQLITQAVKEYSGRPDGPHANENLVISDDGKNASWVPAGPDFSPFMPPLSFYGTRELPQIDVRWLDNGEWISIAMADKPTGWQIGPFHFGPTGAKDGQMLWQGPNPFGRVSAFLCSGEMTPLRTPEDARSAFLDELITVTQQQNVVSSIRATASRNRAASRAYTRPDPDSIKSYMEKHNGELPPDLVWKDGAIPYILGEIKEMPVNVDPDLDKLAIELEQRRGRYISSAFTNLSDPEIIAKATLGAWLGGWDAGNQLISKPVGLKDVMIREILEAIEHSITWLDEQGGEALSRFDLAGGAPWLRTSKGQMDSGTGVSISGKMLDFPHEIRVTTASHSLAQQQQLFEMILQRMAPLPDGRPGVGTYQDLYDAIDESDPEAREETMALEQMYGQYGAPYVKEMAIAQINMQYELDTGVRLPLLQGEGLPTTGPQAGPPANGPEREAPPVTEPISGGSGPGMQV